MEICRADAEGIPPFDVVIFGGAGFIGRSIVKNIVDSGKRVLVVDSLADNTNHDISRLSASAISFMQSDAEQFSRNPWPIGQETVVIDAMGWTRHLGAQEDPYYDIRLNLVSHLHAIDACRKNVPRIVVFIGSRHQYGKVEAEDIVESSPQVPLDVQSTHKVAAESHWRMASIRYSFPVISVRAGNVFGEEQPLSGPEIGLVATMMRDAVSKGVVTLNGGDTSRPLVYSGDLADLVLSLQEKDWQPGFHAMNMASHNVVVSQFARLLCDVFGASLDLRPMPAGIASIDVGRARLDDGCLRSHFPGWEPKPLIDAIVNTMNSVRERLTCEVA